MKHRRRIETCLADTLYNIKGSCITGAVYIDEGSNASFGGETMFANNTSDIGGTMVTYTRLKESQMATNKTFSRKRMF